MPGSQIDFRKLIRKAKSFPDRETWRIEDPATYNFAVSQNVIDRPEVSRHMDLSLRGRVTYADAVADVRHYKSQTTWRDKSPVIFWAAWANEWLSRPEIVECVPHRLNRDRIWNFEAVCKKARNYSDMESWNRGDRASFRAAKRNLWLGRKELHDIMSTTFREEFTPAEVLIRDFRLLISPADISRSPEPVKTRTKLYEAVSGGRLYALGDDLFVKSHLDRHPPETARILLAEALKIELRWDIRASCDAVAHAMGLPHNRVNRYAYESLDRQAVIDLSHICKGASPTQLIILKAPRYRMDLGDDFEERLLRGLLAVPTNQQKKQVEKNLGKLNAEQLIRVKLARKGMTAKLGKVIDAYLG